MSNDNYTVIIITIVIGVDGNYNDNNDSYY